MPASGPDGLADRCERLRSLHLPGTPLLLPNVWDVATARAVVAAGFPVVATTSWGVAGALGFEDDEQAPPDEMLAAAARITRGVEVPVTIDLEAGYGMEPAELVAALREMGAAGCNLEDTDHAASQVRDLDVQVELLRAIRQAASELNYPLVINARVDTFFGPFLVDPSPGSQAELVTEALQRARAYQDAGADCVYPICLWENDPLRRFVSEFDGPVNIAWMPDQVPIDLPIRPTPSPAELADLGVARVSWAIFLYLDAMVRFQEDMAALHG